MLAEGRAGEARVSTGVLKELRFGPYGELIVNDEGLGRYFEVNRLGRMYIASAAAASLSTGGAVTNPVLAIYNPQGSGRAYSLIELVWQPLSNTGWAAHGVNMYYNNGQAAGAGAANIVPVNAQSLVAAGSTARVYSVVTNALANAPTFLKGTAGGFPVTYSGSAVGIVEEIAGKILVIPGSVFAVNASVNQTGGTANVSLTWVEIDWPLT